MQQTSSDASLPVGALLWVLGHAASAGAAQPHGHPFFPCREQQQRPATSLQEARALRQLQGPRVAGKAVRDRDASWSAFADRLSSCNSEIKPIS